MKNKKNSLSNGVTIFPRQPQGIEESEEKTMLAQYMQPLREITLVRLLKQVSQVYQSICFNKLLALAPFTNR